MLKSVFKTTKSKVILTLIIIVSVIMSALGIKLYQDSIDKLWLPKTQNIILEYGDTRAINEKMFLTSNDNHVTVEKIDFDIPLIKDDVSEKSYYKIGNYRGILHVKVNKIHLEFDFKVVIKDTTAPKLKVFNDRVIVNQGYTGDFKEFFVFEDLDDIVVSVDRSAVNVKQVGEYKAIVTAVDASNNKTEKDFIVEVRPFNIGPGNEWSPVVPPKDENEEEEKEKEPVISSKDVKVEEEINFETIRIENPDLPEGEELIMVEGEKGIDIVYYRVKYIDGIEQSRAEYNRERKKQKTDKVIHVGAKPIKEESENRDNM